MNVHTLKILRYSATAVRALSLSKRARSSGRNSQKSETQYICIKSPQRVILWILAYIPTIDTTSARARTHTHAHLQPSNGYHVCPKKPTDRKPQKSGKIKSKTKVKTVRKTPMTKGLKTRGIAKQAALQKDYWVWVSPKYQNHFHPTNNNKKKGHWVVRKMRAIFNPPIRVSTLCKPCKPTRFRV